MFGIDVSSYTPQVPWSELQQRGLEFAFAKATEALEQTDEKFATYWAQMKTYGVPRGAYHYGHPNLDAQAQAKHFYATVGTLAPDDLQPVLDLEVSNAVAADQVVEWALDFADAAEALFQTRLIVYTGNLWRNLIGNPACPAIGARRLWTARYGTLPPVIPKPWTTYDIWQFSDGVHNVPEQFQGLQVHCDWNCLRDGLTVDNLRKSANRPSGT
jgi:lysozyme